MSWTLIGLAVAMAAEPEAEAPRFDASPALLQPAPLLRRPKAWSHRWPRSQQRADGPPIRDEAKHRSRNLLLGAVGTEVLAGALLGGAMVTRNTYVDSDEPTRGMYRANRIMGHAGYASAVAGGALVLGSISMWEW